MLRPDAIHTSYVVGVAWMDTKLLKATLYSGSQIPGGGPYTPHRPDLAERRHLLVAAFNAGFLMSDANGGYYTDGKTDPPAADRRGLVRRLQERLGHRRAVGPRRAMAPDVVSVRQNLDLLVDNGQAGAGGIRPRTPRSGAPPSAAASTSGARASGSRRTAPSSTWAARASTSRTWRTSWSGPGAVRAMELDINTDWVNFSTYQPSTPERAAPPRPTAPSCCPAMTGTPGRYFEPWWARDFITMSAAVGP